jgi:hypothetical protein
VDETLLDYTEFVLPCIKEIDGLRVNMPYFLKKFGAA